MEGDPQTRISSARSFWGAVDCAATGSTVPSRPVAGSNAKPAAAKTVAVSAPAPVPEPTFIATSASANEDHHEEPPYLQRDIDPSFASAGGVYTDHQDIAIALGEVRSVYNEIAHGYTNGDILTDEYSDGETHYQSIPAEGEPVRTPVATPTKNAVLISGYGEDDDVEGPAYQDDADVAYGDATNSESASSSEDDTPADVYTDTDASGYSDNGAGYSENSSNDTGYSDNGRDGYTDNAPQTQHYDQIASPAPASHINPSTPSKSSDGYSYNASSKPATPQHGPAQAHPEETYKHKNWNKEFQDMLLHEDTEDKYLNLGRLANEFFFVAETYGKVIISELSVPPSDKTIEPVSIGGIAGGEKYIVQGILFKFALDISGIYGGDENAMKAASHELKGLGHYWMTATPGLHFPLMCLINYCGFCLVAMSILPIRRESLMYGSADGGKTVNFKDPILSEKMKQAASRMNLKGHYAGNNVLEKIYGPGDIEGHRGSDGKYYVVDFARTFPPEATLPGDPKEPGRILYKLLRPELVLRYSTPLSSDALTGWGKRDPQSRDHNAEVVEATKHLLLEVIPEAVLRLLKRPDNDEAQRPIFTELKFDGINLRHMGLVRNLVVRADVEGSRKKDIASRLLVEMISRAIKSRLDHEWRKVIRTHFHINQELCKEEAVKELNLLLGGDEDSEFYWMTTLKASVLAKYKGAFVRSELEESLKKIVSYQEKFAIVMRVQELTGVSLTAQAMVDLEWAFKSQMPFKVLIVDIAEIRPRSKHMQVVEFAKMQALFMGGIRATDTLESDRYWDLALRTLRVSPNFSLIGAEKLLSFASLIAKKAKSGASKHVEELVRQLLGTASRLRAELRADVLVHAGILYRNLGKSAVESIPLFREAVALKPNSIVAWLQLAKSLNVDNFEHKQEALSAVQKVLEIDPNNPKAIATWGNILIGPNSFNEPPETFKELSTAARAKYIEAYKLDPKAANWISCKSAAEFGQKHLVVLLQTILEIPELASKLSAGFAKLRAGGTLVITELPELTDDMLLAFAAAGPHTLSRIRLLRCTSITDVGVNALIESCKNSLTQLQLPGCVGLSGENLTAIFECMKLNTLNISNTCLNTDFIAATLRRCPDLTSIDVSGITAISDESFELIADTGKDKLEKLSLGHGIRVSPARLLELLQRFNSLWALSFECNDAITWKDIRLLLSIPTIVEVTLAGTKIFSKVILEDASDLAHPSLESIVSGEGHRIYFSGKCQSTYNLDLALNGIQSWRRVSRDNCYRLGIPVFRMDPPSIVASLMNTRYVTTGETVEGIHPLRIAINSMDHGQIRKSVVYWGNGEDGLVLCTAEATGTVRRLNVTLKGHAPHMMPSVSLAQRLTVTTIWGCTFRLDQRETIEAVIPPGKCLSILLPGFTLFGLELRRFFK